jgi:PIN domain nuclease of toxin-antitoxin system
MRYLIDTHVALWLKANPEKISKTVLNIIQDLRNEVFVSTVSFWEISLKFGIGKLYIDGFDPEELEVAMDDMRIAVIGLNELESLTMHRLMQSERHKDPFDRMLVWQAITRDLIFISNDASLQDYRAQGLRLLW